MTRTNDVKMNFEISKKRRYEKKLKQSRARNDDDDAKKKPFLKKNTILTLSQSLFVSPFQPILSAHVRERHVRRDLSRHVIVFFLIMRIKMRFSQYYYY